jgi:hypothetical protein
LFFTICRVAPHASGSASVVITTCGGRFFIIE